MIAIGDVLLLEDTATVVTVVDGNATDGWACLNEQHARVIHISDAAALHSQATFGVTPAPGRPTPGSLVCTFRPQPAAHWSLDGYATIPAFGTGSILAVLTNIDDPTISCYVDQNSIFMPVVP